MPESLINLKQFFYANCLLTVAALSHLVLSPFVGFIPTDNNGLVSVVYVLAMGTLTLAYMTDPSDTSSSSTALPETAPDFTDHAVGFVTSGTQASLTPKQNPNHDFTLIPLTLHVVPTDRHYELEGDEALVLKFGHTIAEGGYIYLPPDERNTFLTALSDLSVDAEQTIIAAPGNVEKSGSGYTRSTTPQQQDAPNTTLLTIESDTTISKSPSANLCLYPSPTETDDLDTPGVSVTLTPKQLDHVEYAVEELFAPGENTSSGTAQFYDSGDNPVVETNKDGNTRPCRTWPAVHTVLFDE